MNRETRLAAEFRLATDNGVNRVVGYASVFNKRSVDLGGFYEYIDPAAFNGVSLDNVVGLVNHDANLLLSRSPNTLTLKVDNQGLAFDMTLPDTSYGRDLVESMKRGGYWGMFICHVCWRGFLEYGQRW